MDTVERFGERQKEFHKKLSGAERLEIASSMYDTAVAIVESSLLHENSELSKSELKAKTFARIYGDDFDFETRKRIELRLLGEEQFEGVKKKPAR